MLTMLRTSFQLGFWTPKQIRLAYKKITKAYGDLFDSRAKEERQTKSIHSTAYLLQFHFCLFISFSLSKYSEKGNLFIEWFSVWNSIESWTSKRRINCLFMFIQFVEMLSFYYWHIDINRMGIIEKIEKSLKLFFIS